MYLPNAIMFHNIWVSCFSYLRMWWFREFYPIDNCCSDHMHMFYQLHVNIVVNPLQCLIINEILCFIGNYIYSQPVFLTFFTIDASLYKFKVFQNPRINLDLCIWWKSYWCNWYNLQSSAWCPKHYKILWLLSNHYLICQFYKSWHVVQ